MKKFLFLFILLFAANLLNAQTLVFRENFEPPSNADSVIASGATSNFSINTRLHASGSQCDSTLVSTNGTAYLTTKVFSTIGYSIVFLKFSHICKIEIADRATIEVSVDSGATWVTLDSAQYINPGTSQFGAFNGYNYFHSSTYANSSPTGWSPTDNTAKPTQLWWKNEIFDISDIAQISQYVMIRFKLRDANSTGAFFNHGWYLDDIKVECGVSELIPPSVTLLTPFVHDTIYNTGPWDISANIQDASGIDTAYIVYKVNNGPDLYAPMHWVSGNTYTGTIPSYTYTNPIRYHVHGVDNSLSHNFANTFDTSFYIKKPSPAVVVGTGTSTSSFLPTYGYNKWGWGTMVYKASELSFSGQIDSISFYVNNSPTNYVMQNQKVFIGHTNQSNFGTLQPDTSTMTVVYNGSMTFNGSGWHRIKLANPFIYNGTSNIVIYWKNKNGVGGTGYPVFRYTSTPNFNCTYKVSDTYSNVFPTSSGQQTYNRPNLRIAYQPVLMANDAGVIQITEPTATAFTIPAIPVKVKFKNFSIDTLRNVTIKWSLDGVYQDSIHWVGLMPEAVVSLPFPIDTSIFVTGTHTIKAWTVKPNGFTDPFQGNDTASITFFACGAGVNGSYTIGSGGDFATIAAALAQMQTCGVTGPTVFNIISGTYTGQINIPAISGVSATNTITFQSATGINSDVTLQYAATGSSDNYVLRLNDADYIRFKNLTIKSTSATNYGNVVELINGANYNRFEGNIIQSIVNSNSTTAGVYSYNTSSDNLNVFQNNKIQNGYYGIYFYGSSNKKKQGNKFINNEITGWYYYGIYLNYNDSVRLEGNLLQNGAASSYNYHIYSSNGNYGCKILKNRIQSSGSNTFYGIYIDSPSSGVAYPNLIANNFISQSAVSASAYGIYLSSASNTNVYYNSVNITGTNTSSRALYQYGSATGINLVNNSLINTGGGLSIYVSTPSSIATSDFNDLFTTGTILGYWNANVSNLAAWVTASTKDQSSVSGNPAYVSLNDLHTNSMVVRLKGTPIPQITSDIDGETRSYLKPTIGADEVPKRQYDLTLESVLAPNSSCLLTSSEPVTVVIRNIGKTQMSNFYVYYKIHGQAPVSSPPISTILDTIGPNDVLTYTFPAHANLSAPGNYLMDFYVSHPLDNDRLNDTLKNREIIGAWDFNSGPYTQGFESTENYSNWTYINSDGSAYKWIYPYNNSTYSRSGTNCAQFSNSTTNTQADWLFSRCINLEAGKTYKLSFWYRTYAASSPQTLSVKYGNAASIAGMTNTLVTLTNFTNATYVESSTTFIAAASGTFYFGWSGTSGYVNSAYIDDINLKKIPDQEASLEQMPLPVTGCNLTTTEPVSIKIKNTGGLVINSGSMTAYYQKDGGTIISAPVNPTTPIQPGSTYQFTFPTTVDLSVTTADVTFIIKTWIVLVNDPYQWNDVLQTPILSKHSTLPPTTIGATVAFGDPATLYANSPNNMSWYVDNATPNSFHQGDSLTTVPLFNSVTYYVDANSAFPGVTKQVGTGTIESEYVPINEYYNYAWSSMLYLSSEINYTGRIDTIAYYVTNAISNETMNNQHIYMKEVSGNTLTDDLNPVVANMTQVYQGSLSWSGPGWKKIGLTTPFNYNGTDNLEVAFENWSSNYFIPWPNYPKYQQHTVPSNMVKYSAYDPNFPAGSGTWLTTRPNTKFISGGSTGCPSARIPVTATVIIPPAEVSPMEIIAPISGCTYGSEFITAKFLNVGADTLDTPYIVKYYISGNPVPFIDTISIHILPNNFITYTFDTPANMPVPAGNVTYTITVIIYTPLDTYHANDTLTKTVTLNYSPPSPIVANGTTIYGNQATLTANPLNEVKWYANPTGGTALGTGYSFNTSALYGTTIFYADATNMITGTTTVGTGGNNSSFVPLARAYNYGWSSSLYTPSELGFAGRIDTIEFNVYNAISGYNMLDQKIYLKQVSGSPFANLDYPLVSSMTLVYQGPITYSAGWVKIPLTTPFMYDGVSNLELTYENHNGTYTTGPAFFASNVPTNMVKYQKSNASFPTITGVVSTLRANTKFVHSSEGCPSLRVPDTAFVTNPPLNDVGVYAFSEPVSPTTLGTHDIKVILRNYGSNAVDSILVKLTVNGGSVISDTYLPLLLPDSTAIFKIAGSFNFNYMPYPGFNNLVAWTEFPLDPTHLNDTSETVIDAHNPLNGVYYINTTSPAPAPDFNSFTEAITVLNSWGVSGQVTFMVGTGTYNEQISVGEVQGTSAINTVTFQSYSGNSSDVTIQYAATGTSDNYVVQLNGSDYIRFKNMTIKSTSTANYGKVIALKGTSRFNIFEGNSIEALVVTANNSSAVYCDDALSSNNTFTGNKILNGYQSIYLNGNSSNRIKGFKFINNEISNYYNYGFYLYYNDSVKLIGNKLTSNSANTSNYGVYAYYCRNNSRFEQNNITYDGTGSFYGMVFGNNNATSSIPNWVVNNFVSNTGSSGTAYGIYLNTSNYINVYYNSVNIAAGNSNSSRAFYQTGGTVFDKILNNNFANAVGGYAMYVATPAAINMSNYNNLYTNGIYLAYWTVDHASLGALQGSSGKDLSSKSVPPGYISNVDLHTNQILLAGSAIAIPGITTDYDGDPRNATAPCIGADEYNPPLLDAGVFSIAEPLSPASVGLNTFKVKISNYGLTLIQSPNPNPHNLTVKWRINGGVITSSNPLNVTIPSLSISNPIDVGFPITLAAGISKIEAWTSLAGDATVYNDTAKSIIFVCNGPMNGTYTIGSTGSNYPTFNDAITALSLCGIGGPITFNVASGTYNESINLGILTGMSATNTITFQSATGNNNDVILQSAATAAGNDFVVKLNGAKYVRFKNMTIKSTTTTTFGNVIVLANNTDYNVFEGNKIQTITTTTSTIAPIYTSGGNVDFNKFIGNEIKGGYNGVYWYGATSALNKGNEFRNNTLTDWYNSGLYLYYNDSVCVLGNTIRNGSNAIAAYSLYSYSGNSGCRYEKNQIYNTNTGITNGLAILYAVGTAAEPTVIANNMISEINGTTTAYGIVISTSNYANVYYNSVNIHGGSASDGRSLFVSGGSNVRLKNNNLVNSGPGYAYYNQSTAIIESNYNNIYTTSSVYAHWTSDVATLALLKNANSMDQFSVSADPVFTTVTNLHATSVAIDGKATPITGITNDIDGDIRNTSTPDIGADEFTPLALDIAILSFTQPTVIISPEGTNLTVAVKVRNCGSTTVTSFTATYVYGITPVTQTWNGSLAANAEATVVFTNQFSVLSGVHDLCAYVHMTGDVNSLNDTLDCLPFKGIPVLLVPYSDNFEGPDVFYTGGTNNSWEYGMPASVTINTAHSPTHAWKTNLDGFYNANELSPLYTPYFNFIMVANSTLDFWHYFKTDSLHDGGRVKYSLNGGTTWLTLGLMNDANGTYWYNGTASSSGSPCWTGNSKGWKHSTFNLSTVPTIVNATTPVQFKFEFESDASSSNFDGWAIDDFELTAPPIPKDAGVIAIITPDTTQCTQTGSTVTVTVRIKNFGTTNLTSIPVKYKVGTNAPVSEVCNVGINVGAYTDYTFLATFVSPGATYDLCTWTSLTGDIYWNNDSTCHSYCVSPATKDVGVKKILWPNNTSVLVQGHQDSVKISIKNYGLSTETTFPVNYRINGSLISTETWSGPALLPGDTAIYQFVTHYTVPIGNYQICSKTLLSGDVNTGNDDVCGTYSYINSDYEYSQWDLFQNVPNPANNSTVIGFDIPNNGKVRIEILDLLGNIVFVDEKEYNAGKNQVEIDVNSIPAGIYFYSAKFDNMVRTKRMVITK